MFFFVCLLLLLFLGGRVFFPILVLQKIEKREQQDGKNKNEKNMWVSWCWRVG